MAGEMNWRLPWSALDERAVREAADALAADMEGVVARVENEDDDCVSLFLDIQDPEDPYTVELSFYDLEGGQIVMSLEEEWSDNGDAWDAACQYAEDLAARLRAHEIDLA